MHAILVGLSHKTANLDSRESLHIKEEQLESALKKLVGYTSLEGGVILSTCNRVEIYAASRYIEDAFEDIVDFISKFHRLKRADFDPFLYKEHCSKAVDHLMHVVSSLDSMVLGEEQVLGQVKEAYFKSKKLGYTNTLINKLFQTAIQTGKKVRHDTLISKGAVSYGSVAVELLLDLFPANSEKNVLLIGAGKISSITARNLRKHLNCRMFVTNRSREKAHEMAADFNAFPVDYDQRHEKAAQSDIIIVSTSADEYVLEKTNLMQHLNNKDHQMVIVDLSVPRNVDPAIEGGDRKLYSVDDMESVIQRNLKKRSEEIYNAEEVIETVSEDYFDWYAKQTIIPVMQEIRKEFDALGVQMFNQYENKLSHIREEDKEAVMELLEAYSDKIIKVIMRNMKYLTKAGDLDQIADNLKHSFKMDS